MYLQVSERLLRAISICLIAAFCVAPFVTATSVQAQKKWHGWWELGGYLGSDDTSRGEAAIFAPLAQSATSLFFADFRGKLFEKDVKEGNLALGHRRMLASGWNAGIWAGADIRESQSDNTFWQVAGGLEALSPRWDLRVNGYLPLTDRKMSPAITEVQISGANIVMVGAEEVPLHGVDGEIGLRLHGGEGQRTEVRVFGGGFWFDGDRAVDKVAGPRARIEYRIEDVIRSLPGSRLTLEGEFSHDDVRNKKWELGARLRIPLGGSRSDLKSSHAALTLQERRMTEALERDTDIITVQSEEEGVTDTATEVDLNQVAVANDAASLTAGANMGANTLIIVQGGGTIDLSATNGQVLQAKQTVQGGGSTIQVRGRRTRAIATFRAPGPATTLFSNDTDANTGVLTAASDTHLVGLDIQGPAAGFVNGNVGIRGINNLDNVIIEKNTLSGLGHHGIDFEDSNTNVLISNNSFSNISGPTMGGRHAVSFGSSNRDVTISGNTMSDSSAVAVNFDNSNQRILISNNIITDTLGIGINNNNIDISVLDNRMTNSGFGINVDGPNNGLTISRNTISGTTGDGISINDGNTNVLISDNTLSNIGDGGVNDDAFAFNSMGNVLLAGSTGNSVTTAPNAGQLCRGGGNFTGTIEITDQNGVLQTFTNGC